MNPTKILSWFDSIRFARRVSSRRKRPLNHFRSLASLPWMVVSAAIPGRWLSVAASSLATDAASNRHFSIPCQCGTRCEESERNRPRRTPASKGIVLLLHRLPACLAGFAAFIVSRHRRGLVSKNLLPYKGKNRDRSRNALSLASSESWKAGAGAGVGVGRARGCAF